MIHYIGLDFEATGSEPWGSDLPIEIGISSWGGETGFDVNLESRIGGWQWGTDGEWNDRTVPIHHIEPADLVKAPPVWQVDITMAAALLRQGLGSRMWNIVVGWNVAGYDRQFITRWFPNLNRLFSYRTLDLNAVIYSKVEDEKGYEALKREAKSYAQERMTVVGATGDWHSALYDARASMYALEFLRGQ